MSDKQELEKIHGKEKDAFEFIREQLTARKVTPTRKEVAEAIGHSSPRTGSRYVDKLIEKGYLKRISRNYLALTEEAPKESSDYVLIDDVTIPKGSVVKKSPHQGVYIVAVDVGNNKVTKLKNHE